jgi:hypothetical protein
MKALTEVHFTTDRHDETEVLLKVVLNIIDQTKAPRLDVIK